MNSSEKRNCSPTRTRQWVWKTFTAKPNTLSSNSKLGPGFSVMSGMNQNFAITEDSKPRNIQNYAEWNHCVHSPTNKGRGSKRVLCGGDYRSTGNLSYYRDSKYCEIIKHMSVLHKPSVWDYWCKRSIMKTNYTASADTFWARFCTNLILLPHNDTSTREQLDYDDTQNSSNNKKPNLKT